MADVNYNKLQTEIERPQRLCLHCGKCMPIFNGNNLSSMPEDTSGSRGPTNVWEKIPESCGFAGWAFYEREKQKHIVRKIKEEIHALSFLPENALVSKDVTVKERIQELNAQILPWNQHGAKNW